MVLISLVRDPSKNSKTLQQKEENVHVNGNFNWILLKSYTHIGLNKANMNEISLWLQKRWTYVQLDLMNVKFSCLRWILEFCWMEALVLWKWWNDLTMFQKEIWNMFFGRHSYIFWQYSFCYVQQLKKVTEYTFRSAFETLCMNSRKNIVINTTFNKD